MSDGHDQDCESEWVSGAMAYTVCGCGQRGSQICRYCRSVLDDDQERRWRACTSCYDEGIAEMRSNA